MTLIDVILALLPLAIIGAILLALGAGLFWSVYCVLSLVEMIFPRRYNRRARW
jgi:hypothetical protein